MERLLTANISFMSAVDDKALTRTPHCFWTLWPLLCLVSPLLRGRVRHLTQQDVDDLVFSLSRECARRGGSMYV